MSRLAVHLVAPKQDRVEGQEEGRVEGRRRTGPRAEQRHETSRQRYGQPAPARRKATGRGASSRQLPAKDRRRRASGVPTFARHGGKAVVKEAARRDGASERASWARKKSAPRPPCGVTQPCLAAFTSVERETPREEAGTKASPGSEAGLAPYCQASVLLAVPGMLGGAPPLQASGWASPGPYPPLAARLPSFLLLHPSQALVLGVVSHRARCKLALSREAKSRHFPKLERAGRGRRPPSTVAAAPPHRPPPWGRAALLPCASRLPRQGARCRQRRDVAREVVEGVAREAPVATLQHGEIRGGGRGSRPTWRRGEARA